MSELAARSCADAAVSACMLSTVVKNAEPRERGAPQHRERVCSAVVRGRSCVRLYAINCRQKAALVGVKQVWVYSIMCVTVVKNCACGCGAGVGFEYYVCNCRRTQRSGV